MLVGSLLLGEKPQPTAVTSHLYVMMNSFQHLSSILRWLDPEINSG
jgi:hypothetical protein